MGDVVNLRQARKRAAKSEREAKAADNRIAFGTPKALKRVASIEATRQAAKHDGARLDGSRRTEAKSAGTTIETTAADAADAILLRECSPSEPGGT